MFKIILVVYRFLFARKSFYKFNKGLYYLSLRGLGILNYESYKLSGEKAFIESYFSKLKKGAVLDIGANIGNYSKNILKISPDIQIYAFEPHPITYKKLTMSVVSKNFYPFNLAVGSKNSELQLYDYEDQDGSSHASIYKEVIEVIHKGKAIKHDIKVVRMDNFLEGHSIDRIDLLKIDTEGNELAVLKGLGNWIQEGKIKAIHFEFNEMNVISRSFFKDFWDILPNYNFYRMVQDGLISIDQYNPVDCEIYTFQNILALIKEQE